MRKKEGGPARNSKSPGNNVISRDVRKFEKLKKDLIGILRLTEMQMALVSNAVKEIEEILEQR